MTRLLPYGKKESNAFAKRLWSRERQGVKNPIMALTILTKLRADARLTLESVAADVNLSTSQIQRFEKGDREPRLSELQRIAHRFGITVGELIGEGSSQDVPILNWPDVSRLASTNSIPDSIVTGHKYMGDLPNGIWIGLKIIDDSMDRIAPVGSTIIVNVSDRNLEDGKHYIISLSGDHAVFRKFRANPDRLQPYSINPDHETIYLSKSFSIIGRVWIVKTELN